jgi:hypothetical protein
MPASLVQNESILAIEVGAAVTRAVLFDVVEGQYRFVASGQAPSTAEAPFKDIGLGVRAAITNFQNITGSILLGQDNGLIAPAQPDGSGVDAVVATLSAAPACGPSLSGCLPTFHYKARAVSRNPHIHASWIRSTSPTIAVRTSNWTASCARAPIL